MYGHTLPTKKSVRITPIIDCYYSYYLLLYYCSSGFMNTDLWIFYYNIQVEISPY